MKKHEKAQKDKHPRAAAQRLRSNKHTSHRSQPKAAGPIEHRGQRPQDHKAHKTFKGHKAQGRRAQGHRAQGRRASMKLEITGRKWLRVLLFYFFWLPRASAAQSHANLGEPTIPLTKCSQKRQRSDLVAAMSDLLATQPYLIQNLAAILVSMLVTIHCIHAGAS